MQVATQRVKTAQKAEIPHIDEPVSKIENVGVQTQNKLQDIKAAAEQIGVHGLSVVHNCITTGTVCQPWRLVTVSNLCSNTMKKYLLCFVCSQGLQLSTLKMILVSVLQIAYHAVQLVLTTARSAKCQMFATFELCITSVSCALITSSTCFAAPLCGLTEGCNSCQWPLQQLNKASLMAVISLPLTFAHRRCSWPIQGASRVIRDRPTFARNTEEGAELYLKWLAQG